MSRRPIVDEFTDKPLSRQQKYQMRMRKANKCILCGNPKEGETLFCESCRARKNAYQSFAREGKRNRDRNEAKKAARAAKKALPPEPVPPSPDPAPATPEPQAEQAPPVAPLIWPMGTP